MNPKAYLDALDKFAKPGDVCSVFTPDDSHFEIISAGESLCFFSPTSFVFVCSVFTLRSFLQVKIMVGWDVKKLMFIIFNNLKSHNDIIFKLWTVSSM